jgi:hypothetical protein
VINFRTLFIVVPVAVFCASFAFMMWQRQSQDQPVSIPNAARGAPVETPATETVTAQPPPPPRQQFPAAAVSRLPVSRPSAPTVTEPSEEPPAPPLPIAFHIRNLRNLNRIEGEVRNNSSEPLSVTLQDVSPGNQVTSEWHLDIAPGETKPYSTDDGFGMTAHDQLVLHSPPFKDRSFRIP